MTEEKTPQNPSPQLNNKKVLDFAAQAQEALMLESNRTSKIITYLCLAVVIAFFVWAALVKVETVTVAEGKVISASKIQNVESLDGGIIDKVYVKKLRTTQNCYLPT